MTNYAWMLYMVNIALWNGWRLGRKDISHEGRVVSMKFDFAKTLEYISSIMANDTNYVACCGKEAVGYFMDYGWDEHA